MPDAPTGYLPQTQAAIDKMRQQLAAQGYTFGQPISGFRTYEDQRQLYANYLAGRQGQPLPYPNRGAVALAARPGTSPHEFGAAFDTGFHGAELAAANAMAPSLGLTTVAGDPGHFQLAGYHGPGSYAALRAAGGAPSAAPVAASPTSVAAAPSAAPSVATRSTPVTYGTSLSSNPFMHSLEMIESSGRNIPSGVDKDYPGQPGSKSQGFFQIDTPTWRDFAAKAGVDLTKYPNAMSAPHDVQAQVASMIPIGRFGPRTQTMLHQQFGNFDKGTTVGALASQFGQTSGGTSSATGVGSNVNTTPAGASAEPAGGSTTTPGTASGTQPPQALAGFQAGSPAEKSMLQAGKTLGLTGGGGQGGGQDEQMRPGPPPPMNAQAVGGPMMMGAGGMNMMPSSLAHQQMAQQMPQMQLGGWRNPIPTLSPGVMPGAATGLPAAGLGMGTSLNSPSQLQMAMMYGFPPYGQQQSAGMLPSPGGGGYGGSY